MNKTTVIATLMAFGLAGSAFAQDKGSTAGNMMKKAAGSDSGKNMSAKALSKVGMDITPSAAGSKVYILEPKDKAEIKGPVKVVFGLVGMGIAPAGTQIEHTGHHHLLIDKPEYDPNAPLPASEQIVHFGKGQTEAVIELKPGKHTLQLLLGDWKHQPHNPSLASDVITITVK